jgi:hypothetical protein
MVNRRHNASASWMILSSLESRPRLSAKPLAADFRPDRPNDRLHDSQSLRMCEDGYEQSRSGSAATNRFAPSAKGATEFAPV